MRREEPIAPLENAKGLEQATGKERGNAQDDGTQNGPAHRLNREALLSETVDAKHVATNQAAQPSNKQQKRTIDE